MSVQDEPPVSRLYRWVRRVLSILLLVSGLGSLAQGLMAWPAFAIRFFSFYQEMIRSPIARLVDTLLPVWIVRPPISWYDAAIVWTSTAVALEAAHIAEGERSVFRQLVEKYGLLLGVLWFIPTYLFLPFALLYNVLAGRKRAREYAWSALRFLALIYGVAFLLLFFLWQYKGLEGTSGP
jgi:hypothetical protein